MKATGFPAPSGPIANGRIQVKVCVDSTLSGNQKGLDALYGAGIEQGALADWNGTNIPYHLMSSTCSDSEIVVHQYPCNRIGGGGCGEIYPYALQSGTVWEIRICENLLNTSTANIRSLFKHEIGHRDAILDELKSIHRLLERDSRAAPSLPRQQSQLRFKLDPAWPSIGRADAPLTLVQFSDYQCPFCKRFHTETFAALNKSFIEPGLLRVVFRDLPLPMHPNAIFAAEAARCAAEQSKFAPMHELLMSGRDLNVDTFLAYGQQAGLDGPRFKSCLDSHKFKVEVEKAASDALAQSISGTPTFVLAKTTPGELSGDVFTGALPFSVFESAIKKRLETK